MSTVLFTRSMPGDIAIAAHREPEYGGVALRLRAMHAGSVAVALPLTMATLVQQYQPTDPFLRLDMGHAQQLMDELWKCGLRPTEGTGSAGALAATQAHLEDMRRLCFEFAGAKGPEL